MSGIKVEPWCDDKCLPPKVTNHDRVWKLTSPNIIGVQIQKSISPKIIGVRLPWPLPEP